MSNPAADVLREARALVEKPEHWTKGTFESQNEDGEPCFCAIGALDEAATLALGEPGGRGYAEAFRALRKASPFGTIALFNDDEDTTHDMILDLFDRAIEAVEQ